MKPIRFFQPKFLQPKFLQPRTPSLKFTLAGAVLATIGLTAVLVYLPWAMASRRNVNAMIAQVNQEIALGTSQEVKRLFTSAQSAQQLIQSSFTQAFIDPNDSQKLEAFFLSTLQANPDFTWIQLGYTDGDFIGAQRTLDGQIRFHRRDWNPQTRTTVGTIRSYADQEGELKPIDRKTETMNPAFYAPQRPWYQNALQNPGRPAWTVYVYRSTNAPGMDATVTLKEQDRLVGVIGVGIELSQLSSYLRRLKGDRVGEVFILNAKQELIASSDAQEVFLKQQWAKQSGQLKRFSETQNSLLRYANQTLQNEQVTLEQLVAEQKFVYTDPQTGQRFSISLAPVGYLGWVVGTVIPEETYLAEVNRNKRIVLVVIGLFVVTTAGLSVLAVDRVIASPILRVVDAAADMEAERFQQDSLNAVARRTDELGQLARVFQTMAKQIYARERQLKQQVKELRIEIDEAKRQKQVNEIVESDFFQDLIGKAQTLRKRHRSNH